MDFTQHIEADKLTTEFIDYVKKVFKGKKIILTVEEEQDTTEYLLSSEANREKLMKSIEQAEKGEGLIKVNLE
ncbi:MAG TPA: hypothetical protein VG603_04590 [Chitinophagales bacterium]|nr:hypothetical protein [Chitinophagales bacterium]